MAEHMANRELFKDKPGYEGYLNFRGREDVPVCGKS